MSFMVLSQAQKDSRSKDARLYVFRSGDFYLSPRDQLVDASLFRLADRKHVTVNARYSNLNELPFMREPYAFISVVLSWVTHKTWRLTPLMASKFRELLVDKGFNLLYLKDDTYRISYFRASKFRVKFYRAVGSLRFTECNMSRLNHTTVSGYNIYFHG